MIIILNDQFYRICILLYEQIHEIVILVTSTVMEGAFAQAHQKNRYLDKYVYR